MSSITIPAAGYAPASVRTLATQVKDDVEALEAGGGITFAAVNAVLAAANAPIAINGQGITAVGAVITFAAAVAAIVVSQVQDASAAGGDLTIQAQQGASGFGGGGLHLKSGEGGSGGDVPGGITLDMGFGGGQGGGISINAGSEGALLSINAPGSGALNMVFASASIASTSSSLSLRYDGTKRLEINNTGLSFFNAPPVAKPTVSGAHGSNAALESLLTALSSLGLITDSTS